MKNANQTQFDLNVDEFFTETKHLCIHNFKLFVLDLLWAIIEGTPVDKGRLARSWSVSFDEVGKYKAKKEYNSKDAGKWEAFQAAQKKMSGLNVLEALPAVVYLYNNLPYAEPIEFSHHSQKAPEGMVRIAIAEMKAVFGVGL